MMASMIRTQIQLEPETREALRHRAFEEKKTVSALVREILKEALAGGRKPGRRRRRYDFSFIGEGKGDPAPVAENHDDYLDDGPAR